MPVHLHRIAVKIVRHEYSVLRSGSVEYDGNLLTFLRKLLRTSSGSKSKPSKQTLSRKKSNLPDRTDRWSHNEECLQRDLRCSPSVKYHNSCILYHYRASIWQRHERLRKPRYNVLWLKRRSSAEWYNMAANTMNIFMNLQFISRTKYCILCPLCFKIKA
jgi:hypothetical protein